MVPVRPEGVPHPVDVARDVGAVPVEEGLLREVEGQVEELRQVPEQRAVDGGGRVAQQEGLVTQQRGDGPQVVEGEFVRLLGGVARQT